MKSQRRSARARIPVWEAFETRVVPSAVAAGTVMERSAHAPIDPLSARVIQVRERQIEARQEVLQARGGVRAASTPRNHPIGFEAWIARAPFFSASAARVITHTNSPPATATPVVGQPASTTSGNALKAPTMNDPILPQSTQSSNATSAVSGASATSATNPAPANLSQQLQTIYNEYQAQQGDKTFSSSLSNVIQIQGTNVGVDVKMSSGDFNSYMQDLQTAGMQVTSFSSTYGIVEGMLPISQLPAVATNAQTLSVSPIYLPRTNVGPVAH